MRPAQSAQPFARKYLPYLIPLAASVLTLLFVDPTHQATGTALQYTVCIAIGMLIVAGILLYALGRLTFRRFMALLFLIGLFIRVLYILYTPYGMRQHDVEGLDSFGHLRYINELSETFTLPSTNQWQFYHPPLHHFISALWVAFGRDVLHFSQERVFEGIQCLTLFYASAAVVVIYRILRAMNLSNRAVAAAMCVVALHPTLILLSGSINNDILSILFFLLALLYLIRWFQESTLKNIIILALALGCSMMAKLSAVTLALIIAAVFVYQWSRLEKPLRQRWIYGQFALFGLISIPLGIWHSARNYILFGQPLGSVPTVQPDSPLYCGDYTLTRRFLTIPFPEFWTTPYCSPSGDYSVPGYILKCAVFGEYKYPEIATQPAWVLLSANILLTLLSLCAAVYVLVRDTRPGRRIAHLLFALLWFVQMASFVSFNIAMPFGCTMDYRYIVPTLLTGAYFLAAFIDVLPQGRPAARFMKGLTYVASAAFAASSLWMYASLIQ